MALTAIGHLVPLMPGSAVSTSNFTIDAAGEEVGLVFRVPRTGNLSAVTFRVGTATDPQDLLVSLQNVDAAGDPDGTADQSVVVAGYSASSLVRAAMGAARAVTAGDVVAVVIGFNAAIGNVNIVGGGRLISGNHYIDHKVAGAWSKSSNRSPILSLEYSDGAAVEMLPGAWAGYPTAVNINTGSTPDELGNLVNFPVAMTVCGVVVDFDASSGDCEFILYDAANNVLGTTGSTDKDHDAAVISNIFYFTGGPVDLSANTDYRLVAKPSTATSVGLMRYDFRVAQDRSAWSPFGQFMQRTQRTDAGAWSESTTALVVLAPIISKIHDGAGDGSSGVLHGGEILTGGRL